MNIYSIISKLTDSGEVHIYLDMDGVLANYDVGNPSDYLSKRALVNNIDSVKFLSTMHNVELYILTIYKSESEQNEKILWLEQNANFIKKENRIFLKKEDNLSNMEIKNNYIKGLNRNNKIVFLDSDISSLEYIKYNNNDVVTLNDSELVD